MTTVIIQTQIERDGKIYLQTKKIHKKYIETKIRIPTEDRRLWSKFGDAIENKDMCLIKELNESWILPKKTLATIVAETPKKPVIKCRNCNGDHFTMNCKVKKSDSICPENKKEVFYENIFCGFCKQKGHFTKDCKVRAKKFQESICTIKLTQVPDMDNREKEKFINILESFCKMIRNKYEPNFVRDKETGEFYGTVYIKYILDEDLTPDYLISKLNGMKYGYVLLSAEVVKSKN